MAATTSAARLTPVISIGILGRSWRAAVTGHGSIVPGDGGPELDWAVAAEDRWHRPAHEPTVRQARIGGAPVLETRVRVPHGDVVQRVYATPGPGGLCLAVMEIENASPRAVAVAVTRADLLTARPPAATPIEGIELPAGSVVFPLAHATTIAIALAETVAAGPLPADLPGAAEVAQGWISAAERASRLELPDAGVAAELVAARSAIVLDGPPAPADDPDGFLLAVGELVRMGDRADWAPEMATAVERIARRRGPAAWDEAAALDAAARVLQAAGERRAVRDVARIVDARSRASTGAREGGAVAAVVGALHGAVDAVDDAWHGTAADARLVAATERRFAVPLGADHVALMGDGFGDGWLGVDFAVHGVPCGPNTAVSYAIRWHGARPALLWEVSGDPVVLTAPVVAPGWVAAEPRGETLWPAPSQS